MWVRQNASLTFPSCKTFRLSWMIRSVLCLSVPPLLSRMYHNMCHRRVVVLRSLFSIYGVNCAQCIVFFRQTSFAWKIRSVVRISYHSPSLSRLTCFADLNPMVRNSRFNAPTTPIDHIHRSRVLETLQIAFSCHALHYDLIVYRTNILHLAFSNPWYAPDQCHGNSPVYLILIV